jgi:hypothetical protein
MASMLADLIATLQTFWLAFPNAHARGAALFTAPKLASCILGLGDFQAE